MGSLPRIRLKRGHAGYWAAVLQRVSGVGLALFLPLHFALLGSALQGAAGLDAALAWTHSLPVRIAEIGLVLALALHLGGGIRVLLVEFLGWHDAHKNLFALACATATGAGLLFAFNNF